MKKLVDLLNRTKIEIVKNDTVKHGRFTVVTLVDSKGHEAIGISRQSAEDKYSETVGESVARGRAERALYTKLNGKKIRHSFMG